MGLRIVAVHRYFWPDTPPYAFLLRTICEHWADKGHAVEVLSTQPSYKPEARIGHRPWVERLGELVVRRVPVLPRDRQGWRKAVNAGLFPMLVAGRLLCGTRPDVVMCSTAPPVLLGAAVSIVARWRHASFVYHCMDLHPEIGALSGQFRNRTLYRLLMALERGTCRRASAVIVLSEDMRRAVLDRDPAIADNLVIVNNFDVRDRDASSSEPLPLATTTRSDRPLRLLFAGNIGRFQGLETIVRAVASSGDNITLVFMGEGSAKAELLELARGLGCEERVQFRSQGSVAQARALMREADLGIVSLSPHVVRYAYPSKTMTYLSEGLPILAVVEPDSQLAEFICTERIGYTVAPGDVKSLVALLRSQDLGRDVLAQMRLTAREAAAREFDSAAILGKWDDALDSILRGRVLTHA